MTYRAVSMLAVLVGTLGGCSREPGRAAAVAVSTPPPVEVPLYVESCPLSHLRGVHAQLTDVPMGVAIVFEAPDRAVDLLRANIHRMATAAQDEGNPFMVCPCRSSLDTDSIQATRQGSTSDLGATSMQRTSSAVPPPASAFANDIPTGSTLVLTGADDDEVALLRSGARRALSAMDECLAGVRY